MWPVLLWLALQSEMVIVQVRAQFVQHRLLVAAARPNTQPASSAMNLLSLYVGPNGRPAEQQLEVRCRTSRPLNNLEERIVIEAIVLEDVVSVAGKILIPACSKIVSPGFVDAERGRVRARGHWTIYVADHQIRAEGTMWGEDRREGLSGEDYNNAASSPLTRQAIYRDGIYLYILAESLFTVRLSGHVSIRDLPSAYDGR